MQKMTQKKQTIAAFVTIATFFTGLVFTVYFLFFRGGNLIEVEPTIIPISSTTSQSSNISTNQVASTTPIIIAFGDSITAGYGISIFEAYPQRLQEALLSRGIKVKIINSGVIGETTAGGLRRAPFVATQKPDIVIVALGGNDLLRGIDPANTKANLAGIITTFQKEGITVILAGMKAPTNLGPTYVKSFDSLFPELAKEFHISLIPFLLDGVALDPHLNQADGIHPNQQGAIIIAEKNILPIISQNLQ